VLLHTLCVFRFPLTLIMMHLCITQCTYWTPLFKRTTAGILTRGMFNNLHCST